MDFIKVSLFASNQIELVNPPFRENPFIMNVHCHKNPGLCGLTAIRMLDVFIDRAAERGLLVMLDNHRNAAGGYISPPLWYDSNYTETEVIDLWKHLVKHYRNQWNVFAIDLKNEPSYEEELATWGNSNKSSDWNKAAERMIRRLGTFKGLYFVDGINHGTDLGKSREFPLDSGNSTLNNRVVYSAHCYGPKI
ncbi:hypothetical protein PENTCL1PPCAC_18718, partial [Pristionchus entomophagus]